MSGEGGDRGSPREGAKRKRVVAVEDAGGIPPERKPFLQMSRRLYRNRYEDGSRSRPYAYEYIHRRGYDAVAISPYYEAGGEPHMAVRPGIRVPVYFRKDLPLCIPDGKSYLFTPEAVAGSLEPGDSGVSGLLERVVAEVEEEAGFRVDASRIEPLGGGFFPSHGQSSEKIFLCAVPVDPREQREAFGDGSVNEADAPPIVFRPVREILLDCVAGRIEDPKIELLASRLCLRLGYLPQHGRYLEPLEKACFEPFRAALEEGGFRGRNASHGEDGT